MAFRKPSYELSVSGVLRESLSLYLSRLEYFLIPFLFVNMANSVLSQLIGSYLPPFTPPKDLSDAFFPWLINYATAAIALAGVFIVTNWLTTTIANGIAVKYSSDLLEGRHASLREAFSFAFSHISSLIATGFITGVLMTLGLILFLVPGIIVAIMFSVVVQAITIERLGVSKSLRRSRELVAKKWGKTFMVLLSVGLTTIVASLAGDFIGDLFSPLKVFITAVIASLAQPLYPVALTYHYYSLRSREKPLEGPLPVEPAVPVAPPSTRPPSPFPVGFQPKFCYKCGQKLPPGTVFCPQCGNRVKP